MKKLIETSRENLIVCDNKKCNYKIPYSEEGEKECFKYVDQPCPCCGDNLLTVKDYIMDLKVTKTIKWINKWFSWLTLFDFSKNSKKQNVTIHVHEGININIDKKS